LFNLLCKLVDGKLLAMADDPLNIGNVRKKTLD